MIATAPSMSGARSPPRTREREIEMDTGFRYNNRSSSRCNLCSYIAGLPGFPPPAPATTTSCTVHRDIQNAQCDMHGLLRDGEIYGAVTASVGQVSI